MMKMQLSLRMEIHDDECIRCREPKPSNRECASCAFESADIVSSGSAGSAARNIDEAEAARTKRRKENQ